MQIIIAPSLLAADFTYMGRDAAALLDAGADWLHCDVMDGWFVPNISFGPQMIRALRSTLGKDAFLDVHMMVKDPERYIPVFLDAGANMLTLHAEACDQLHEALASIRSSGCRAGLALNPDTEAESILPYIQEVDMVLCMSVYPGFGGQKFIPDTMDKIARVATLREEAGATFDIQVDGGVGADNAALLRQCGANVLVAGSAVFRAADKKQMITSLRG